MNRNAQRCAAATVALALLTLAGCSSTPAPKKATSAWAAESGQRSSANATFSANLDPETHADGAYRFCIQQITDKLKAPATARFSQRNQETEETHGYTYIFSGTVDSENSFGALLRSTWYCEIVWTGGSDYTANQAYLRQP